MNELVLNLGRGLRKIDNAIVANVLLALGIAFGLPHEEAIESLHFT
jgi:hypothetical protein